MPELPEPLAHAVRCIDDGVYEGPGSVNRITGELTELADGLALVESFSHVVAWRTGDGLVLFDTSHRWLAGRVLESLRAWSADPVHTIVYTHGHADHVGGAPAVLAEAAARELPRPRIVGHEDVPARFDRYRRTAGYNHVINQRQFGGGRRDEHWFADDWVEPSDTYRDRLRLRVGDLEIELHHARGETDDHSWAWLPERKTLCTGDLVLWVFPNAGNPQKVQRYPLEWASALREMAALDAEMLVPAHGLPIPGADRIRRVLDDVATVLEVLTEQTLVLMNEGATLDRIVHEVEAPAELLDRPYLRPVYDEPEFVVRNVWRLYGGWYDGNPARLKPAPDAVVAGEVASLVGGVDVLAARAAELADAGEHRLAAQLAEWAVQAAPDDATAHRTRAEVYRRRRHDELSLMARGIYSAAAAESRARAETGRDEP